MATLDERLTNIERDLAECRAMVDEMTAMTNEALEGAAIEPDDEEA